jgi:alkylation response protein AidB-like acyl-CoA dehydrogenase
MNFELTEEQIMFRDMARKFAEQEIIPNLKEYERQGRFNRELVKKAASLGLIGIHMPQEYGGLGLDYITLAIVIEQISWASSAQAACYNSAVLPGSIILAAGTEEQKQRYLPALCKGEKILAMAAVEPNAGSDGAAIETSAILDGEYWVINGVKEFTTNGGIADVVLVLVQTDKSKGPRGHTLIAVDKGALGFSSLDTIGMVGFRSGNVARLRFVDCRVPRENMIGEVGKGFRNAMIGINTARFCIVASCVGMAQSCLESCIKYAKQRHQFGKPIGSFQLVQGEIAKMAAQIDMMRCYLYYLGDLKNRGLRHIKETAIAKYLASEMAVQIAAQAVKLHGAYGCVDDYLVEHHYRDAIIYTILGGTPEMQKLTIGQQLLDINALS